MEDSSFQLLSSTRYDKTLLESEWNTRINEGQPSPFMLLKYHLERLADAATQHGWTHSLSIDALAKACDDAVQTAAASHQNNTAYKVRILLSRDGTLTASAAPIPALQRSDPLSASYVNPGDLPAHDHGHDHGPIRTIYLDPKPTQSSLFTRTKTTKRAAYDAARARVNLAPLPTPSDAHLDVLLHTPAGDVSETSIRNVAFWRGGRWVTPNAGGTGCLPGVVRRALIEEARVVEARVGELKVEDLTEGETVLTMNGVEGCCMGRIAFFPHDS